MPEILVARQPIYTRALELYGYELLYREHETGRGDAADADAASSQVIINTFLNIGLEKLVGSSLAFINVGRGFVVDERPLPMAPEQVVLEVSESVSPERAVVEGLVRLRERGYRIALDNFVADEGRRALLGLAHIAKIDARGRSAGELAALARTVKGQGVQALAARVESHAVAADARSAGFDYLQGAFFCRPDVIKGRSPPPEKLIALRLLERLQDPEVAVGELERLIIQDVTLTYKLLRYVNCATFALRREISSVRDALVLVGLRTLKNWVSLILISRLGEHKPRELVTLALVRARMSELLAARAGGVDRHQAFTIGLFSVLDAVMDRPMVELLDTLPFNQAIKFALLAFEGEAGQLLRRVLAYEQGEWSELHGGGLSLALYREAWLEALRWAEETRGLLT
jgi:EAL and modified HD-GYP domain-containing signal transduction protein